MLYMPHPIFVGQCLECKTPCLLIVQEMDWK